MPVTAKLSENFYSRLGHDVAEELVDWFNSVDETYRSEFRELFAAHFRAFDTKLEQRIVELWSELHREITELRSESHQAIARLETRLIR